MTKPVLQVLNGETPSHRPIWLMRQAGRYLPEYRSLRAKAKDFLNMCLTPEWASEVTLQPIRRYGFDAAIVFADILLIPYALGLSLEFREGEGPILQTVDDRQAIENLSFNEDKISAVYQTLRLVKPDLPDQTTLIGFCGAPWTVACYMIDGNSRQNFAKAKGWVKNSPDQLDHLIKVLVDASEIYLESQIKAGAEVLQIFDSWAGALNCDDFRRFSIQPTKDLVARLKAKYPHIPIIGFPREASDEGYYAYIRETGVDAMSLDTKVDLVMAQRDLQIIKPLQGNLDPQILVRGGDALRQGLEHIMRVMGPKHILNLGHGIVPETPLEHVAQMMKIVRDYPA